MEDSKVRNASKAALGSRAANILSAIPHHSFQLHPMRDQPHSEVGDFGKIRKRNREMQSFSSKPHSKTVLNAVSTAFTFALWPFISSASTSLTYVVYPSLTSPWRPISII